MSVTNLDFSHIKVEKHYLYKGDLVIVLDILDNKQFAVISWVPGNWRNCETVYMGTLKPFAGKLPY